MANMKAKQSRPTAQAKATMTREERNPARRNIRTIGTFTDEYGEERVVRRLRKGKVAVARQRTRPAIALTKAIGEYVGQRVRQERLKRGITANDLADMAGLSGGKQRIYWIENCMDNGVRIGTVYALAHALGLPPTDFLPPLDWALEAAGVVDEPRLKALGVPAARLRPIGADLRDATG